MAMLSDGLRTKLEGLLEWNEAQLTEFEKMDSKEGTPIAVLIEHFQRNVEFLRRVLGRA
jgi:hypothetical protein